MSAKFPGPCKVCIIPIKKFDDIVHRSEHYNFHFECYKRWKESLGLDLGVSDHAPRPKFAKHK